MKKALVVTMITLFSSLIHAQNKYSELWYKVNQFDQKGLPKSALKEVENIYNLAKAEKNAPQIIKSILFKSKYTLILEENAQLKVIASIKNEIAQAKIPEKNILESVLATVYWQYFKQNRWKFYNRTNTKTKQDSIDFRTWNLQTLFTEISKYHKNALQNGLVLQQKKLKSFDAILYTQENSKKYRPTVYDFIAHNALDFYKTGESNLPQPENKFEILDSNFLGDTDTFLAANFEADDIDSQKLQALKVFKNLTLFHKNDKDKTALVYLTLERLDFVKENARFDNVEEVLFKTLKKMQEKYRKLPISTEIDFRIASYYFDLANQYSAENPIHQFTYRDALETCEIAKTTFPNTTGTLRCQNLKNTILKESYNLIAERNIETNKASFFKITYKNVSKLYFRVYKTSEKQEKNIHQIYNNTAILNKIKKQKFITGFEKILKSESDFQQHSTEIILPKLKQGYYVILASTDKEFYSINSFAYTFVQVSNIAINETHIKEKYIYQVVNRETGKPLENAKVRIHNLEDYSRYNKKINKTLFTDTNGFVSFSPKNYHSQVVIDVSYKDEKAKFKYFSYNKYRSYRGRPYLNNNVFLFTDRSIYRPAQTVYFKGIAVEKTKNHSEIIANEKISITLKDANYQNVKTLEFKTNEYGSFSGEFILPNTGLTGNYSLQITGNNIYVQHNISVEEYKRPKFYAEFNPIKESLKLNDSITVKGVATAYAGSKITDAKVVYRVKRNVQYPKWYYWYNPNSYSSEAQEIAHGETTTNAKGEFEIPFFAQPDLSVSKKDNPVFTYEISADITDINGETRSTTTKVKIGYHTLTIAMEIADKLNKNNKENKIILSTNNLNGEFVATKGTLKIYKAKASDFVKRERPWSAPDYQVIDTAIWNTLFPHDYYKNQNTVAQKGALLFQTNFDTEKSKEITLKKMKKWQSGLYIAIAEGKDKFQQKIIDKSTFTVYSNKDKKVSDNKLFTIKTDKNSYKPNENVVLTIGSASKDISVTIYVEKDKKIVDTQVIKLSDEIKNISIPVTNSDLGGFVINYNTTNYNYYKQGRVIVNVPYPKTDLEIETLTFRDKLQPNQEQTWSFKIKGSKGDKAVAEILASMYDASLDQFKAHNWSFNPIQHSYYSSILSNRSANAFGTINFRAFNKSSDYSYVQKQNFDKLNWFGFSLQNSYYQYKRYIQSLKNSKVEQLYDANLKKGLVRGTVSDQMGPIADISVSVKGKNTGTVTDFDGNYQIKATEGDVLVFEHISYNGATAIVGKNNVINVWLSESGDALEEVVVSAYSKGRKFKKSRKREPVEEMEESAPMALQGKVAGVAIAEEDADTNATTIRGYSSISANSKALIIVDGVILNGNISDINPNDILAMRTLKGVKATALYGAKAKNGVILITTKKGLQLDKIKARTNFNETAFFFPHLHTDEKGNVSFTFTTPESLTKWKLQLLAHTKELHSAIKSLETVTQKKLMVLPNAPRFLRQGDTIVFSSKISNLSAKNLNGYAQLSLVDAITNQNIDTNLGNTQNTKQFSVDANGNTSVSWKLHIPFDVQTVQYKIVAKAGNFSDGEQNMLPVLTNRMLVTETLPMWIRSNQTKTFTLDKLKNTTSVTRKNYKLTLEITSNPAWYAVQALPYLMEYPYECAEQTFSRYYANTLANYIANSNPKIQNVFKQWKNSDALLSNLEKNQELKSLIIQETPWLRDAQSETEQKKRIALLFDLHKMKNEQKKALKKLKQIQMSSGGFPWFKGSRYENRYITQYIVSGIGHLDKLQVFKDKNMLSAKTEFQNMLNKAIAYLDKQMVKDYNELLKTADRIYANSKNKEQEIELFLQKNKPSNFQIHYLYTRSFFKDKRMNKKTKIAMDYYTKQAYKNWFDYKLYTKGLLALVAKRNDNNAKAEAILRSIKEHAITSDELGMYWKENTASYYWYQAPIETQALLIEAFSEINLADANTNTKDIDNLKIWLLKNKQTNRWQTTKATSEAVYALLLQGTNWIETTNFVNIKIGNKTINPLALENTKVEAGTGYFKTSFDNSEITPEMAEVTLKKEDEGIAWGAMYWQYFEDLDKITFAKTPLQLTKKLFVKTNGKQGKELTEITDKTTLKLGDLVTVRIELKVDRKMEFIHLKDMRASGFEPVNVLSRYKWQDGLGYYESTKDAATNFFIDNLPKGVYVFEYDLRVNNKGNFSNGITTIQSMYAPEFSSHSKGIRVKME